MQADGKPTKSTRSFTLGKEGHVVDTLVGNQEPREH